MAGNADDRSCRFEVFSNDSCPVRHLGEDNELAGVEVLEEEGNDAIRSGCCFLFRGEMRGVLRK